MVRKEITDVQWEQLRPVLPPQKPKTGRPNNDHRIVLSGIVWILRTGAPWHDLPACFGSYKTVASRFYRWRKAGIWQRILKRLQQLRDQEGRLDWLEHFVDGTVVRAHQHAAGAKGGTRRRRRWAVAVAASAPKSTCASSAGASCSSCS
jgi:transposase